MEPTNTIGTPDFYKKAIEKTFLIINKNGESVPFILNEVQQRILSSLKGRDLILKARQEGVSSLVLAMFTVDWLSIENIRCVVVSHETNATQKLLDKVKFFLSSLEKTFPGQIPYKLKYNSRNELVNEEKNSVFYIGTAGSRTFGRGDTIQNLLCSELSFWPEQEKLMIGLLQAVPRNGRVIIESTANGVGNYHHNTWKKAENGISPFKPHFLAWFDLKEYTMPIKGAFYPTEEEKELQVVYSLTNEQLYWRRWKIRELGDNLDAFYQEYPSNPQEAFIVSGNPVWSPTMLNKYLLRCKKPKLTGNLIGAYEPYFEENSKGYIKIWEEPIKGHDYVIGADVAEGIEKAEEGGKAERTDFSAAYVLDRMTAEIVASWHGRIEADVYGNQLDLLGRFYNQAFIGVERNHQGLTPLIVLRNLNYPRLYYREKMGLDYDKQTPQLGWWTDRFTRPLMVDESTKWLREGRITIYDEELIGEMMSFVRYPDGQGRATKGAFDDRVISFMITLQMYTRNPFSTQSNDIEKEDNIISSMLGKEETNMLQGDLDFSL